MTWTECGKRVKMCITQPRATSQEPTMFGGCCWAVHGWRVAKVRTNINIVGGDVE